MTKSWRPKGWKTPNALALGEIKSDVVVTSDQVRFLTQEQIETYEAGADAMLEALRQRKKETPNPWDYIPDDEE